MNTPNTTNQSVFIASVLAFVFVVVFTLVNSFLAVRSPVSAAGETLTISAPVVFSSGYTLSSAQFIDNSNSAYFLDPAASGNSLVVAGNVGIGTTSPGTALSVNGVISGSTGNLRLQATGTGTGSTGTGSIYFLNSSGNTVGRFDTIDSNINATGGTITTSGQYRIHTFTTSGTFTPGLAGNVEYLVVGGGGGGSGNSSAAGDGDGGGGAGGFRSGTGFAVTAQAYTITVGAGGAGSLGTGEAANVASNGSGSVFSTITATGGGGGAGGQGSGGIPGGNGGSGGGAGSGDTSSSAGSGNTPSTSPSQGNNGGAAFPSGSNAARAGGGGGGSSAIGANASSGVGGNGGAGTSSSISGSSVTYAGGGGGGSISTSGSGGAGGGGAGASSGTGNSGTANTGGGGGGGATNTGGTGGSGIVIIRYPTYGTLYLGATNTSSADLAEYYISGDPSISAGDVVVISNTRVIASDSEAISTNDEIAAPLERTRNDKEIETKGVLRKATHPYDRNIIGIISTNPGVIMGSIDGDTGKKDKRMLALSGRVPVKVDPDSEPIEVGDFLTSSARPGLARKATRPGYAVGRALEAWNCPLSSRAKRGDLTEIASPRQLAGSRNDNCSSTIEAFVSLGYYVGELNQHGDLRQLTVDSLDADEIRSRSITIDDVDVKQTLFDLRHRIDMLTKRLEALEQK